MSETEQDEAKIVENWSTELITKVKVEAKDEREARRKMAQIKIPIEPTEGVHLGHFTILGLDPVCPVCGETVCSANPYPKKCYCCGTKLKLAE